MCHTECEGRDRRQWVRRTVFSFGSKGKPNSQFTSEISREFSLLFHLGGVVFVFETGFLHSPDCPRIHYVVQVRFELTEIHLLLPASSYLCRAGIKGSHHHHA